MPAYNAAATIRDSIESALRQSFTRFELVVVDNGSNDSTRDIVRGIRDGRLRLFSEPRRGAAVSRNSGLARASGAYICFLDADDLWASCKLEQQLQALCVNPQAAVAYSWTDLVDDAARPLLRGSHIAVSGHVYGKLLIYNFIESGSNVMIRRAALDEVGGFDEGLVGGEDWDLWLRLAERHQFVAVPQTHVYYRMSLNSVSADVARQERDCVAFLNRVHRGPPGASQSLKSRALGRLYRYLALRTVFGRRLGRLPTAARFALTSVWVYPRPSAILFVCVLCLSVILVTLRAHGALYWISKRLPAMKLRD